MTKRVMMVPPGTFGAPGPATQRKAPREEVVLLAFLSGMDGAEITQGVARTIDLSPLGAALITPRPVPVDVSVQVELLLPSKLRLATTDRVVHGRELRPAEWRLGIAFDEAPRLISSIQALSPEFSANED